MKNPELTELARMRTMSALWAFVEAPDPDAERLAELEEKYPSKRTRAMGPQAIG